MRKANAFIAHIILLLFVIHGVSGAFNLLGFSTSITRIVALPMAGLVCVHVVFGIILTVQTLQAQKRAGVSYPKENRLFWARRISGFLIMVLVGFHVYAFTGVTPEHMRLHYFGPMMLAFQLLLVATVAFHVITNVRPALIALGIRRLKPRAADLLFILSAMLVVMAVSFIIYYIRWNAA